MVIEKYGVKLIRLTEDKLELVRQWRNDPKISQFMLFRDHITPEMQQNWFEKINNDNNYYFIIEYKEKEIGLVNIKDIDYSKGEGEAGLFIYDDSFFISFHISLCLNDFFFENLSGTQIRAFVLDENKRAIRFNKTLGYEYSADQYYILSREKYDIAKSKIVRMLHLDSKDLKK